MAQDANGDDTAPPDIRPITGPQPATPPAGDAGGDAGRLKNGQFAPGASGNAGGRPKGNKEFLEMVRTRAPLAVQKLVDIMLRGRGSAQVRAAEIIIEHAWGKPRQSIEATGKGGKDLIPSRDNAIRALVAAVPRVAGIVPPPEPPDAQAECQDCGQLHDEEHCPNPLPEA